MQQLLCEFFKVLWLHFTVVMDKVTIAYVSFSGFCIRKVNKIGSFLTELLKKLKCHRFFETGCITLCMWCVKSKATATLVTPILSLATPSNLGAGSNFASALPTGFTGLFVFPVCCLSNNIKQVAVTWSVSVCILMWSCIVMPSPIL